MIPKEKSIPDYKPIETHLRSLDYIKIIGHAKTWFGGTVVGFNVQAPSLLRKRITLEHIAEEIEKSNLPLIVNDYLGDGYNSFRLMIKL